MSYVIGVGSGFFGAASQEERVQGISAGLFRKAQYVITKGVPFVQVDLESISEFREPDLADNMKRIERTGITFGLHSETPAFGGRDLPHLDTAIGMDYERGHNRLMIILEEAGKLGFKYNLIHSSESTPFLLLAKDMQPTDLVDIWGRPLGMFLDEEKDWIFDWLWKDNQEYIWVEIYHDKPSAIIERAIKVRKIELAQSTKRSLLSTHVSKGEPPSLTPEEEGLLKELEDKVWKEEEENVKNQEKDYLMDVFKRHIESKVLSYGPERTAYYLIAKWMEKNNDPLWKNIVDISIDYYSKVDGKNRDEWLKDKKIEKISIDDHNFRREYRLWVAAVSAKYIWGHFMQEKCPKDSTYKDQDPKKIIKKYNMPFLLETPMAGTGIEEFLRFPNPIQMYYLAKEVGFEYMQLAVDLEHMLMCNQDPEISIDLMPPGGGKIIRVIHAGWPATVGPAHIPIPLGSEQQIYLYKMYYKMRQKGFGADNSDYYIIFERGGGGDPIQQSVIAIRMIVECLEKGIEPDKLPPSFFGIAIGQLGSFERQWGIIEEHARAPLKGLLMIPEEEHTFLGKAAIEKGKGEVWKKEEFR